MQFTTTCDVVIWVRRV